jgi:hypothetical protein
MFGRRKKRQRKRPPKKPAPQLPEWAPSALEMVQDPLEDYMDDPHVAAVLSDVIALVPRKHSPQVVVAGGFAAYAIGATQTHGDIDLFCLGEEAFTTIRNHLGVDWKIELEPKRDGYDRVLKFEFDGLQFDLVNVSDGGSPADLLNTFDINWCMACIELATKRVLVHPNIFKNEVMINKNRIWPLSAANTQRRIKKYGERLTRSIDQSQFRSILRILHQQDMVRKADAKAAKSRTV